MFKRNSLYDEEEQMKRLREQGLLDSVDTSSMTPQTSMKTSGGGMGTEDWVGLGLQAVGAIKSDIEAEKERERTESFNKEQERKLLQRQGIKDRQQAQLTEEEMQMQRRQQNMGGLQYLANQRADAMKNRTAFSFRSNLAKALRG